MFSALTAVALFATRDDERPSVTKGVKIVTGAPAFRQTSDGNELRWHASNLKIHLDSSLDKFGSSAKDAIQLGFGAWLSTNSKLPDVTFDTASGTKLSQKPDGKSSVYVAEITIPGHEQDLALTMTFSREDTGEIVEADLVFNSKYKFAVLDTVPVTTSTQAAPSTKKGNDDDHDDHDDHDDAAKAADLTAETGRAREKADAKKCEQRYDVQNVTAHEVGHFFGLGEDPIETEATMFKRVARCEVHKRHLALTDETAAEKLYAAKPSESPSEIKDSGQGCGGARLAVGSLPSAYGALGVGLGLFVFGAARRRRRA